MPAYARREIVDETRVGVHHCTSRCVRRAFLCGDDALTGKNFDHRKQWIRDRLELLAGFFAVDVLGFAVMSNHVHVLLRTLPDLAGQLSDEEVARHWRKLSFKHLRADAPPAEEEEQAISILVADHNALAERRRRLSSISWEGRFKSQALLDESALLACSMYVDLNLIRAGVADTPETSKFTGAFERIAASKRQRSKHCPARRRRPLPLAPQQLLNLFRGVTTGSARSRTTTPAPRASGGIPRVGRRTGVFCPSRSTTT